MRQPAWDVYETAILIDAYYKMLSGSMTKKDAVKTVSDLLRKRAINLGMSIDSTFRNQNGIRLRFEELSFIDSNSSKGLRNTSRLFRDTMKMYRKDKVGFSLLLKTANRQIGRENDNPNDLKGAGSTVVNAICKEPENQRKDDEQSLEHYLNSLKVITEWLSQRYSVKQSYDYLSDPNKSRHDLLYKVYRGSKDIVWVYMIYSSRTHYISIETEPEFILDVSLDTLCCDKSQVRESHPCQKLFFTRFDKITDSLSLICDSIERYFSADSLTVIDHISVPESEEKRQNALSTKEVDFQITVENAVLDCDLEGISLTDLNRIIPYASILSLKRIRDVSPQIIDLNGVLIHVDAIVDLDEAASKMHVLIEKLLQKNNGYVSSIQFFEYVRTDLQMFLNDNNLCDEQKVYDIARYLFSKIGWQGHYYEFSSGKHISSVGEKALKTNMDVIEKFARDMGGVFQWDELINYLDKVGMKSGNLRVQMKIGSEPIFFYVTSEKLITSASMNIDEAWLNKVRRALQNLFNDMGDHVIIRHIAPIWYEQLPELPQRLSWTPILLQYILQFYGRKLGARTIHSELPVQYDSIYSMVVNDDCILSSFGDAVIAFVIDSNIEERRFYAEDFRKLLAKGGLIGNYELINNLQRAIGNDSRFAWDASGEMLTLLI